MEVDRIAVCAETPLWSLTHAYPQRIDMSNLYSNWPADKKHLIRAADGLRRLMLDDLTDKDCKMDKRIADLDQYLPYLLAIEKIKTDNASIKLGSACFDWKQTPIIIEKYMDRKFTGEYVGAEVLHIIWLKGVEYMNSAFGFYEADDLTGAMLRLRESSGIFEFLAGDRVRGVGKEEIVPVEFQAPVFESFTTLTLAEAYALGAKSGERNGAKSSVLAKMCHAVSVCYGSSLDAIGRVNPRGCIHSQYINWLAAVKRYYEAATAVYLGYDSEAEGETGTACGLALLAIKHLTGISRIDAINKRVNVPADKLLERVKQLHAEWSKKNCSVMLQGIPDEATIEALITKRCSSLPNLPRGVPFVLPDPSA